MVSVDRTTFLLWLQKIFCIRTSTNPEEAADKARKIGMTKGTAGFTNIGNEFEQGNAGANQ
jgi:hypothetical protein